MDDQTPERARSLAAVRAVYAGINQNDIAAAVAPFHPDVERIEPPGFPSSGTYRGVEAVRAHFTKARDTWAEGSCEPEQLIGAGNNVVALVHVRVRLKDSTEWIDARVADVFTFKDDTIVRMQTFADSQEALAWAGAAPRDPK